MNVGALNVVSEVSQGVFISLHPPPTPAPQIFCSVAVFLTILSSRSLHSSASVILLLIPSIVLFISGYLFFS